MLDNHRLNRLPFGGGLAAERTRREQVMLERALPRLRVYRLMAADRARKYD